MTTRREAAGPARARRPVHEADVVVVGLGAMGSAALHQLARRGVRAIGLDRHAPPHTHGSTHGRSRIIREAIFEDPCYVPLVRRAYALWDALEAESGERLFHRTGGLMIGPPDGELVQGARRSAAEHGIPVELLEPGEVRRRFPAYAPPDGSVAVLEARAGLLLPEAIIAAQLRLAEAAGARVLRDTPATRLLPDDGGVVVETEALAIRAGQAVVCAGPWVVRLLELESAPLAVERQLLHWFRPAADPEHHAADRCPLSLWEFGPGRLFATFPDLGDGVKCGVHHEGELVDDPDTADRVVRPAEDARVRTLLAALQPSAAGTLVESRVCLYTNTPDHHFLIDRDPRNPAVLVASPCSGHGFKFSSAIGEALADLATGRPRPDLAPFTLSRFGSTGGV